MGGQVLDLDRRYFVVGYRGWLLTGRRDTRAVGCVNVSEKALRGRGVEPIRNVG